MDNARLEAVMGKWPELRPYDGFACRLHHDSENHWRWLFEDGKQCRLVTNIDAHALIFRAMVEKLPIDEGIYRNPDGSWNVGGSGNLHVAATAFDALLAYWEART